MSSKILYQYGEFPNDDDASDEDAVYDIDPAILGEAASLMQLQMHEVVTEIRTGGVKSTYHGSETGQTVYENTRSGCSVAIDRLVWVDGWRGEPNANGQDEAMTLAVFNLVLGPEGLGNRLVFASLELKLKASTPDGADPRLVAWGPFRRPEMWNITDTHKRTSVTPNVKLSGGGAGQSVSVGIKRTVEQSWDERFTDYGRSMAKGDGKNAKDAKSTTANNGRAPNAVLWQVVENKRLARGISHEIRVAALFAQPDPLPNDSNSSNRYLASVKIVAHISGARETVRRVFRLGQDGSDTINWAVEARPGSTERCYAEGKDIVKQIDLRNLGKLTSPKDITNLDPEWLNKWDRAETAATTKTGKKPSPPNVQTVKAEDGAARQDHVTLGTKKVLDETAHSVHFEAVESVLDPDIEADVGISVDNGEVDFEFGFEGSGGGSVEGENDASSGENEEGKSSEDSEPVDSGSRSISSKVGGSAKKKARQAHENKYNSHRRLVELENRAARAEGRIAEQEQHIFELQQTLTRVSQALLIPLPTERTRRRPKRGVRKDKGS